MKFKILIMLLSIFILGTIFGVSCKANEKLPILQKAPIFELVNQDNEKISLDQFTEKVKVLSFFYTGCTIEDGCAGTAENFQALQGLLGEELGKKTVLVLITINPESDVPEVIKNYGGIYGGDFSNWHFLTGDKQIVEKVLDDYDIYTEVLEPEDEEALSGDGFPVAVIAFSGINIAHGEGEIDIAHSMLTFLIDQDNNVRQIYYANIWEPEKVKEDITALLDE